MDGQDIQEVKLSELEFSLRIDAEYYKPFYVELEKHLSNLKHAPLYEKANFLIGPFGSAFTVENYEEISPYRYIRGRDVKPFFLQDENAFMPQKDYFRLDKYALQKDDVLVSVVGTLGNAAIVTQEALPAIFSCKSTVVRTNQLRPRYLLAYLNTELGKALLLRKTRGTVQTGLNLDDLKSLVVFVPEDAFQKQIEAIISTSEEKIQESKNFYQQAENVLLEHLGLKDWQPSDAGVSVKRFAESFGVLARLDAEHYQPKYGALEQQLSSFENLKIKDLVNYSVSSGATPKAGGDAYTDVEQGVPFIRAVDLKNSRVSTDNFIYIKPEVHNSILKKTRLKRNDVLFSIAGTVGRCALFRHNFAANINQAVSILRFNEERVKRLYVTTFFNSEIGKLYVSKYARQGLQTNLNLEEVGNLSVPVLDMDIQEQITQKVEASFGSEALSRNLLDLAKRGVELAIEESEAEAQTWIAAQLAELGVDLAATAE